MRSFLKQRRGKVVAAAITGAVMAGTAASAYFGATDSTQGSTTGGTFSISVHGTVNGNDLFPVADRNANDTFDVGDVEYAESVGTRIDLSVANQPAGIEAVIGLTDLDVVAGDATDLWVLFCDVNTSDITADACDTNLVPVADLLEPRSDGSELDFGYVQETTQRVFERTAWIFLAHTDEAQSQGQSATLQFNFEGRTTGQF